MPTYTHLGPWIKQRRKMLDLTQEELARQIGYAISTVRKIESGDLRPSLEMAERLAACLSIDAAELPTFLLLARAPQQSTPPAPAHGSTAYRPLPPMATPLIGREYEIGYIRRQILTHATRLITLVGPPGIGKTRLAVETARSLSDAFAAGICYVPLEALSDPATVLEALAQALGIREQPAHTLLAAITTRLHTQRVLLLLDTMEHLLAAKHDLATIIQRCPQVYMLVTSRAALHIDGEYDITVLPLTTPPLKPIPPADTLDIYDSVRLFVSCARLVQPAFNITPENTASIATICTQLDGLPLAIELIAARVKLLSPQRLVERLTPLLTAGSTRQADRPARQHTMRAAIEWSYKLLSAQEQLLLQRLSIFAGGATQAAVEAVYTQMGDQPESVAALLAALLDHSLIQCQQQWNGEPRYTLLTMIHAFAHEQLTQSPAHADLQAAYISYYTELAKQAHAAFRRHSEQQWLDVLAQEHQNLRAIFQYSLDSDKSEVALTLGGLISRFWIFKGHVSEGRRWLTAALAAPSASTADLATQAQALYTAGVLAALQADDDQAIAAYDACMALARALNDQHRQAIVLLNRSSIARQHGDYSAAESFLSAALTLAFEHSDQQLMALALTELALVLQALEEYALSELCYHEALHLLQQLGNEFTAANVVALYAQLKDEQQQYDRAKQLFFEALEVQRALGDSQSIHRTLSGLALVLLRENYVAEARQCWHESLHYAVAIEQPHALVKVLEGFAQLAGATDQFAHAARLWAAAEALRSRIQHPAPPAVQRLYLQLQQQARQALSAEAWAQAWAEGAQMSVEQATALALHAL